MIRLLCVGKIKEPYLKDLINDYTKRINKYHNLQIIEVKDEDSLEKERDSLLKNFKNNECRIALCIEGNEYNSLKFAQKIDELFIQYPCITFIIGSSLGLHEDIKNACQLKISFSKLTFPHGLFRGILLEQIYRSFKINNNETYHK